GRTSSVTGAGSRSRICWRSVLSWYTPNCHQPSRRQPSSATMTAKCRASHRGVSRNRYTPFTVAGREHANGAGWPTYRRFRGGYPVISLVRGRALNHPCDHDGEDRDEPTTPADGLERVGVDSELGRTARDHRPVELRRWHLAAEHRRAAPLGRDAMDLRASVTCRRLRSGGARDLRGAAARSRRSRTARSPTRGVA